MSMTEFARDELDRMCKDLDDDALEMQQMISRDILQIVEIFAEQGHSNTSAAYALRALERLLRFKPLTPITEKCPVFRRSTIPRRLSIAPEAPAGSRPFSK